MIALFSTAVDESTTDVLRWLHHLSPGTPVVRVNADEPERVDHLEVTNEDARVSVDQAEWCVDDLTAVWYRKGRGWLCRLFPPVDLPVDPPLRQYLAGKVRDEEQRLAQLVHDRITARAWTLGHPVSGDLNKLVVLGVAERCGLEVPRFMVTTRRQSLIAEMNEGELVTKALSDGVYFFDHDVGTQGYYSYTETVDVDRVLGLPPVIPPSLVQERLHKVLELRIFFLDGDFYPMAIFSQAAERTAVDFRRYDEERPNRTVPYLLPSAVEDQLRRLFDELGLTTGSVDLVLDSEGRYVFLEINPFGQFSMVSWPCNYQLERAVAATLLAHVPA